MAPRNAALSVWVYKSATMQEAPAGEGEDSCEELSIDADELREHVEMSDASSGGDSLFRSPNVHTLRYTAGNDDNV